MPIAELNIGRLVAPQDDPAVAAFMNALDEINALAESADGFIWRLKDESGNATDIGYNEDPLVITNMSVWRDVDALKAFAFQSKHKEFFARRRQWFEKMESPHFVMWPVEAGHIPDLEEARARLAYFEANGSSDTAFGWQ